MSDNEQPDAPQPFPVIELESAPDLYVEGVMTALSPYGLTLYLQRHDTDLNTMQTCSVVVGKVRMSIPQAWALSKKLGMIVDRYLRETGPVYLPEELISQLGLEEAYHEMHEEMRRDDR